MPSPDLLVLSPFKQEVPESYGPLGVAGAHQRFSYVRLFDSKLDRRSDEIQVPETVSSTEAAGLDIFPESQTSLSNVGIRR